MPIAKTFRAFSSLVPFAATLSLICAAAVGPHPAQSAAQKRAEKSPASPQEKSAEKPAPELPAEIELFETRVRFETDGSSRKEVHALVKINDELGVRQFARLNFDFNRSFEQIEIPLVRITHSNGGVVDILPSAITDTPNPAVVNAPAYQDVRVKSVRILGLEPGDTLEYRVITATSHAPLAPDFWLDHTFDRSGVVSHEIFELDLPASRFEQKPPKSYPATPSDPLGIATPLNEQYGKVHGPGPQRSSKPGRIYVSSQTSEKSKERVGEGSLARLVYKWDLKNQELANSSPGASLSGPEEPDIELSTFASWSDMAIAMGGAETYSFSTLDLWNLLQSTTGGKLSNSNPAQSLYESIGKKITTVDLPFESYVFKGRTSEKVVSSGYGTAYEKANLFRMLSFYYTYRLQRIFFTSEKEPENQVPRPSVFSRLLIEVNNDENAIFLDPSMEVAPYGLLGAHFRGGKGLRLDRCAQTESECWMTIPKDPPFKPFQRVSLNASISSDGVLATKAKYSMRGDNELLLRVALHQTPKENWKNVAQLLALSDGFRGQITSVTASDPNETHDPVTVEFEITQPKFLDWSKKPLRIPALLPLLGLPDPPTKPAPGAAAPPIDLGTPLDVELSATVHLPAGTTAHIPTGTSVARDFATYTSQYSAKEATITASRHLNFILKEIPADRTADYNAFLQAVQNDESQFFTLERAEATAAKPQKQ
ncbi:MAG: DUF3857 domain-containing protein [Candidatus Acidiferrum sp.]